MNDKKRILQELDAAIDAADMAAIDRGLDALSAVSSAPVQPENPKLFSARILQLEKENRIMKKPKSAIRVIIAAAVVMAMGLTVYAAATTNFFSFLSGDRFVTLRTTDNMTEQEARELVGGNVAELPSEELDESQMGTVETTDYSFASVEEAEKTLDMPIPLPSDMPGLELASAAATVADFGGLTTKTLWLNYGSVEDRLFGVTVVREIIPQGETVTSYTTHDIDPGSLDSYKSGNGTAFTLLTESDDAGERTAHIAVATVGEYEYALVFYGFDQAERQAMLDSVDLSVYR